MKPIAEETYKVVMQLIESGNEKLIINHAADLETHHCFELAMEIYVVYLLLSGQDFPKIKKVSKYAVTLDDDSPFFSFYRVAACGGISISMIKDLYNNTTLPEIIITKNEQDVENKKKDMDIVVPDAITKMSEKFKGLIYSRVNNNSISALSEQAKEIKKAGGYIQVYKVIYNHKISYINIIVFKNKVVYDLNSFHCKSLKKLLSEFSKRNKK